MSIKNVITLAFILITALAYAQDIDSDKKLSYNKQFFIENKGQWPDEVLFMTKTNGMDAWITKTGVVYDFYQLIEKEKATELTLEKEQQTFKDKKGHIIKFNLLQCNKNIIPEGNYKQEAYYNYFIGNDKSKWASFVGLYNEVTIRNIYNGIDIRYYFDNSSLRYDYIVNPGADPKQIQFNMEGAEQISLNNAGEIVIKTTIGETKQTGLFSYQNLHNKKQAIQSFFKNLNQQTFAIAIGSYDKGKPLIIDPLIFSTYLGGLYDDNATKITTDRLFNIYIFGGSSSYDFPGTLGSYNSANGATPPNNNIFITKLNSSGSGIIFSTFIGGNKAEYLGGIYIDTNLNIYIAGTTSSVGFPYTSGSYDTSFNSTGTIYYYDGFITKLNASGSALLFSTFLGGYDNDFIYDLTIDNTNNIYVTGATEISTFNPFPTTLGSYTPTGSLSQPGFITKLNPSASTLIYSTLLDSKILPFNIVLDNNQNAIVSGRTSSSSLPTTTGCFDNSYNGGSSDAFLLKINPTGSSLIFLTYLGGNTDDQIIGMKMNNHGNIVLSGITNSSNFPTVTGGYDTSWNGNTDAFVCALNSNASTLLYSTFIGGASDDDNSDLTIDNIGNIYLIGSSSSSDFPTTKQSFDQTSSQKDAIICKLNPSGNAMLYSTFLGGSQAETGTGITLDSTNNIYVCGNTKVYTLYSLSNNFPVTIGSYDTSFNGFTDVFISKFQNCVFALSEQPTNKSITIGASTQFSVNTYATGATFQWQQNNGAGFNNLSNAGPFTGATSNTLNISSTNFSFNNTQYRCIVSNGTCSITSDTALLTINCLFNITRQATSQTVNQGSNTQFSVASSSTTASYQWQQNTGTGFVNLVNNAIFSNVTDDTLIINATPITFNNTSFRCIVTDNACSVTSNAVNLTVNCTLAVNRQPIPLSILVNTNNQFSVATNTPGATFQWQQSLGSGFTNLSSNTVFSNVNDDTLIIANAPLSINNTRYRCIINDGPCTKISDSILLNVICPLVFTNQPIPTSINIGNNGFLAATGNSSYASYQWQQSTGSGFTNLTNNTTFSNVNDDTLLIANAPLSLNNTRYRCVITDGPCSKISDSVLLNVVCTLAITSQPVSISAIANSNSILHLAATCSACIFQWQQNTETGFINLTNNGTFSNVNDDTLLINNANYGLNNSTYRCIITDGPCSLTSNGVILNVLCNSSITRQVTNSNTTIGTNALFSIESSAESATFQWQQNEGTGFTNITNGTTFSGVNDDTLIVNNTSFFQNSNIYRCLVTHGSCIDTSNTGILTINCTFSITNQPVNQNISIGSNAQFIIQADNNNVSYQWQQNTGTGFVNINNNNLFNGTDNDSLLIIAPSLLLNNTTYRCVVTLNNCYSYSIPALLTINCISSITQQPVNKSGKIDESAFFSVASSLGSLVTFKWQINTGTGFIALQNNTTYSGVNQDTLKIKKIQSTLNNYGYRAIVYTNNLCCCSDTSNTATLQVSNIGTNELSNTYFNIYPNPNNGNFLIDELPDNANITITDMIGKTIAQLKTNNNNINIDLSNTANGMYLVKVESTNYSAIRKVNITK